VHQIEGIDGILVYSSSEAFEVVVLLTKQC